VTANTYTHVLSDETELDYSKLIAWKPYVTVACWAGAGSSTPLPRFAGGFESNPGSCQPVQVTRQAQCVVRFERFAGGTPEV